MVLYGATPRAVSVARRGHPATSVLGVVATTEPVDVFVEVLEAGAEVCIRDSSAAVIAGHLMACQRRRGGTLATSVRAPVTYAF